MSFVGTADAYGLVTILVNTVDFPSYSGGGWGPESAEGLISHDGPSWLAPSLPEETP
jgi:hypothetical protein